MNLFAEKVVEVTEESSGIGVEIAGKYTEESACVSLRIPFGAK